MSRRWLALAGLGLVLSIAWGAVAQTKKAPAAASASVSLQDAYKREFAFLQAEKASLTQRLEQQRAEAAKRSAAAEAELATLQGAVLAVSVEADRLTASLESESSRADTALEGPEVIETLLSQAVATLDKGGMKLPEGEGEEARANQVKVAFEQAVVLLQRYASIRTQDGTFFAADGKQVQGKLLSIGNIATYGISDGTAGALAPAGQDRLKVWTEASSDDVARALLEGRRPPTLRIFLYESLDKSVEAKKTQTVVEHITSGGIIAWVIVVLGGIGALMALARAIILGVSGASIDRLVAQLSVLVARGDDAAALRTCQQARGSAARVLGATIEHLRGPRERLEDAVSEAMLREQGRLDRFGSMVLVVAAVAPLLGLLGTVTGMISTFDVITEFGTGDPKMLSGGISEALITTELGLIVAIPMLLVGNVLGGWASGIKDALEKAALRIGNVAAGVNVDGEQQKPEREEAAEVVVPAAS